LDYRPKCISAERGTTLIEVVVSMLILSAVVAGLGSVYALAVDQWEKAALRIRLQQAGTFCTEEVVRSLQSATEIEYNGTSVTARYLVPDLYIDSSVTFRRVGRSLQKNGAIVFPVPGIEKRFQQSVGLKVFELEVPTDPDSLYRVRLVVTSLSDEKNEEMEFLTGFYLRNALPNGVN
jgi:hypothetical protein